METLKFLENSRKRKLRKAILEDVDQFNPRYVLDNGAGPLNGKGSFDYSLTGAKITACDILGGINSEKLPYNDSQFDLVVSAGVLQYLDNPNKALQECWRVLRENGILILTTFNINSWMKVFFPSTWKLEKKMFNPNYIVKYIEQFNFKLIKEARYDLSFIPKKYKSELCYVFQKRKEEILK